MRRPYILFLFLLSTAVACAGNDSRLLYLGNEGVAVFHGDTTLLFDPLFQNNYGHYTLVPDSTRDAMFAGSKPFEDITAVFVSHYHGDHFDPADMLRLLENHGSTHLYAPRQAIDAMRLLAADDDTELFERTTALDLTYKDDPQSIRAGDILVEAFFVPHSGWPVRRTDVQNIAFRVTAEDSATVAHLGDADPNLVHFERHQAHWQQREVDAALPPYWFFNSKQGNQILEQMVRPKHSIGVHVPAAFADDEKIPQDLRGFDLFTKPGESRPLATDPQ